MKTQTLLSQILTQNGDEKKTANGVCQRVTNKEIRHEDYKRCLIDDELMYHSMMRIGHTHHQLESIETLKKSLSPYNDKKWIQKNGDVFTTCSFEHKHIKGKYIFVHAYIYICIKICVTVEEEKELKGVLEDLYLEGNTVIQLII